MSVDLLSCPFCGSDDVQSGGIWGVHCKTCGALSPDLSSSDGQVTWNTRAPDPAVAVLEAEVARLRELVEEAYGEGWDDGHDTDRTFVAVGYDVRSEDWRDSSAIKKINPAPSEKEAG